MALDNSQLDNHELSALFDDLPHQISELRNDILLIRNLLFVPVENKESTSPLERRLLSATSDQKILNYSVSQSTWIDFSKYGTMLDNSKSSLELDPRSNSILRLLDPYNMYKRGLRSQYGAQNSSNAFLKAFEILSSITIDKLVSSHHPVNVFCNAEFPGSFIFAIIHYWAMRKIHIDWVASSLIQSKQDRGGISGDVYNLYKNYRSNWLMGDGCNGDMEDIVQVREIATRSLERLSNKRFDIYTSDLGFDVSSNYNKQEELHLQAHTGVLLTALLVLTKGGVSINKMYTLFSVYAQSLVQLWCSCFERFDIIKPLSSKASNSELYIVGIHFIGKTHKNVRNAIKILSKALRGDIYQRSLCPLNGVIPSLSFLDMLYKTNITLFNNQIASLRYVLDNMKEKQYNSEDIKSYVQTLFVPLDITGLPPEYRLETKEKIEYRSHSHRYTTQQVNHHHNVAYERFRDVPQFVRW